jgi:hypothetical protein
MIKQNSMVWKECRPHVEFAYNHATRSTTSRSPSKVVHGFNPYTPLDLLPLQVQTNMDASKALNFTKKLHQYTK